MIEVKYLKQAHSSHLLVVTIIVLMILKESYI